MVWNQVTAPYAKVHEIELRWVDWNEVKPGRMLGMSKAEVRALAGRWDWKTADAWAVYRYWQGGCTAEEFDRCRAELGPAGLQVLVSMIEDGHEVPLLKAVRYIKKQEQRRGGDLARTFLDYREMLDADAPAEELWPKDLVAAHDRLAEIHGDRDTRQYTEAMQQLAQELAALAGEVGHICRRTLEVPQVLSCKGMTTLLFSERPALRAVFGAASAAARGEVSGDAVQQFCSPTAAQMILCDGMGTGRPAAVDGNLAAELTARLLKAGIPAELAARLVNVALALKSEEESGATLDLISVDLYTGTARLFKAGAAPGFLVHGGRVRAVGEATLPMGVLGGVNGQSRVVHLTAGDYAVLVSDGLLVDGAGWVAKQVELSAAAGDAPEKLAETLVQTARIRAQKTGRPDDITAAVLRLEKSG